MNMGNTDGSWKPSSLEGEGQKHTDSDIAHQLHPELRQLKQYRILKKLGSGGVSVVYLAENKAMGDRREALKVLNDVHLQHASARERFEREISIAATFSHKNIVIAYNSLRLPSLNILAMEYVKGVALDQYVQANGPLPAEVVLGVGCQVAAGLQYAWEKQAIHRDIKPSNLMVSRMANRDTVKILDFGLAKLRLDTSSNLGLTSVNETIGTPHYMAPEQLLSSSTVDIRADIYALACTLYFLLTGAPPFQGSLYEVCRAHQATAPAPLYLTPVGISRDFWEVLSQAMAKSPADRFQTPGEFRQALLSIRGAAERSAKSKSKAAFPLESSMPNPSVDLHASENQPAEVPLAETAQFQSPLAPTKPLDVVEGRMPASPKHHRDVSHAPTQLGIDSVNAARKRDQELDGSSGKVRHFLLHRWSIAAFLIAIAISIPMVMRFRVFPFQLSASDGGVNRPVRSDMNPSSGTKEPTLRNLPESNLANLAHPEHDMAEKESENSPNIPRDGSVPSEMSDNGEPANDGETLALQNSEPTPSLHADRPSRPTIEQLNLDDCPGFRNSLEMQFVRVAAGTFLMGTEVSDDHRIDLGAGDEPLHQVDITRDFWICDRETTCSQFQEYLDRVHTRTSSGSAVKQPHYPVTSVSWKEAMSFCEALTRWERESGWLPEMARYSLPSEAQWEYACRGGPLMTDAKWLWSHPDKADPSAYAVLSPNPMSMTGSKSPNPLGLFDVHGNAWEWVLDEYQEDFYQHSPRLDPINTSVSSDGDSRRVIRGGSYRFSKFAARCGNRLHLDPNHQNDDVGFRVVLVIDPEIQGN